MTDFLLLRLYGPLVSWGDVSVGEFRTTHAAPTKSAVLGLVAAALGLARDDVDGQSALRNGYGFAVRVDTPGTLLVDYHSIETPYEAALRDAAPVTRRDELLAGARKGAKTNLSRREYREDAASVVALWVVEPAAAKWSLDALAEALRRPRYTPYLGRKSCVPALPFMPTSVAASNAVEALRGASFPLDDLLTPSGRGLSHNPHAGRRREYRWEGDPVGLAQQTLRRRDQPGSRTKWVFADREEHVRIETVPDQPKKADHAPLSS